MMVAKEGPPIARFCNSNGNTQPLHEHLENVSDLAAYSCAKIGLFAFGRLLGILHDFGKYSRTFQRYIYSAAGFLKPGDAGYLDSKKMKGRIDHATAGAQYIWNLWDVMPASHIECGLVRQMIAVCIASHHSGLIDCLGPNGESPFDSRMKKDNSESHLEEASEHAEKEILEKIALAADMTELQLELRGQLQRMHALSPPLGAFYLGMLTRFVFSVLIDADRLDAANAEDNVREMRANIRYPQWRDLLHKLEEHIAGLPQRNTIDESRAEISKQCADFGNREKGLYLLTVPTGGGKTLASLRFALRHACNEQNHIERIIYVIPYTSIIDQNAAAVRNIMEDKTNADEVVLEYHSNLTPEKETSRTRILAENWDAPIVFTTAVQFLETLFGSGTRGARRMHQLANSVIIFDEIQTLPIRVIHLFNNAVNFLVRQCGVSMVFCTATQPVLDKVCKDRGAAEFSPNPEMVRDKHELFKKLRRVLVKDLRKDGGWSEDDVADLVIKKFTEYGSVLLVVNTKAAAKNLFEITRELLPEKDKQHIYHLSTNMCPAHRSDKFKDINTRLDPENLRPVICISTQLIEAGVDVDFRCVIRYMAGLDSIAQAAGRCNRNGRNPDGGEVLVVNPANENLGKLPDIRIAKEITERVLDEYRIDPSLFDNDRIGLTAMERFYQYYFFDRADEMTYKVPALKIGHDDTLLSLLSENKKVVEIYKQNNRSIPSYMLRQSFASAAEAFQAIDAPTEGIMVIYNAEAKAIITDLCAVNDAKALRALLKRGQRYSVNVYPYLKQKLGESGCISETQAGSGIMYLDQRYYDPDFGVSTEIVGLMEFLEG